MFEAGQDEKQDSTTKMWIGIFVIVALAALGGLYYWMSKGAAKGPEQPAAAAAAAPAAPTSADALRDLKVQRATMEKDHTGTAVWSVTIQNRSNNYAYSEIMYETTYMDGASKPLSVNKGRLPAGIGPGEQVTPEIRDTLYPAGTVLYKFKITEAKSTAQ